MKPSPDCEPGELADPDLDQKTIGPPLVEICVFTPPTLTWLVAFSWTPPAVVTVARRAEFAMIDPELAVKDRPVDPELWRTAEVVIEAQEIDRFPEVVIDPEGFVNAPVPEQLKERLFVAVVLMAADTAMFPWLLRVAIPVLSWFWMTVGVTFEVLVVPVYQVPDIHSPVKSRVEVETVTAVGMPFVLTVSENAEKPVAE